MLRKLNGRFSTAQLHPLNLEASRREGVASMRPSRERKLHKISKSEVDSAKRPHLRLVTENMKHELQARAQAATNGKLEEGAPPRPRAAELPAGSTERDHVRALLKT